MPTPAPPYSDLRSQREWAIGKTITTTMAMTAAPVKLKIMAVPVNSDNRKQQYRR
jgi:hypothetical protein